MINLKHYEPYGIIYAIICALFVIDIYVTSINQSHKAQMAWYFVENHQWLIDLGKYVESGRWWVHQ